MANKKHALTFVTITVLLDTIGFGIILPVMPEFLVSLGNISLSEASSLSGFLIASYAVTNFFFAPILGGLSDRFGRKPLLVVSLFFFAISYLLAGFATALWVLFLGRILTGVTSATYAVANALIADVSPPDERAQNFGLLGVAFGLGFIIGPALGGIIGGWELRAPFFVSAGLAFANALYGLFFFQETLAADKRRSFELLRANPWGALLQLRRYPMLLGLLLAIFIYALGHHAYSASWNFYTIEKFAWTPMDVGLSLAFVGVLSVIVQGGLLRVVIPRYGAVACAYAGYSAAILSFIGIALADSVLTLYLWLTLSALGGLVGPSVTGIVSNQVSEDAQGELQGAIASINSVAMIAGPLLMTQAFAFFTADTTALYLPGGVFLIAAALSVITLLIFSRQTSKLAAH